MIASPEPSSKNWEMSHTGDTIGVNDPCVGQFQLLRPAAIMVAPNAKATYADSAAYHLLSRDMKKESAFPPALMALICLAPDLTGALAS